MVLSERDKGSVLFRVPHIKDVRRPGAQVFVQTRNVFAQEPFQISTPIAVKACTQPPNSPFLTTENVLIRVLTICKILELGPIVHSR